MKSMIVEFSHFIGEKEDKLHEEISSRLTYSNLVPVQRKHFSESRGLTVLQHLVSPESLAADLQECYMFKK